MSRDLDPPFVRVSTVGPDENDRYHVYAIIWQPSLAPASRQGSRIKLGTIHRSGRRAFWPTRTDGTQLEYPYSALGHAARWLAHPMIVFDMDMTNLESMPDGFSADGMIRAADSHSLNVTDDEEGW